MKSIFIGTYSEAMIIKNLLESSGVTVFPINETMSIIEPVAVGAGGYNTVTLNVDDSDFERSTGILGSYNNGELSLDRPSEI